MPTLRLDLFRAAAVVVEGYSPCPVRLLCCVDGHDCASGGAPLLLHVVLPQPAGVDGDEATPNECGDNWDSDGEKVHWFLLPAVTL